MRLTAVYSEDLLYNTIKGLHDENTEYLSAQETAQKAEKEFVIWKAALIADIVIIFFNLFYVYRCIRVEKRQQMRHI